MARKIHRVRYRSRVDRRRVDTAAPTAISASLQCRRQPGRDLGLAGDAAGANKVLVDDQPWGGQHRILHDLWASRHLDDLGFDPQVRNRPTSDRLDLLAVVTAGAEHFDGQPSGTIWILG